MDSIGHYLGRSVHIFFYFSNFLALGPDKRPGTPLDPIVRISGINILFFQEYIFPNKLGIFIFFAQKYRIN